MTTVTQIGAPRPIASGAPVLSDKAWKIDEKYYSDGIVTVEEWLESGDTLLVRGKLVELYGADSPVIAAFDAYQSDKTPEKLQTLLSAVRTTKMIGICAGLVMPEQSVASSYTVAFTGRTLTDPSAKWSRNLVAVLKSLGVYGIPDGEILAAVRRNTTIVFKDGDKEVTLTYDQYIELLNGKSVKIGDKTYSRDNVPPEIFTNPLEYTYLNVEGLHKDLKHFKCGYTMTEKNLKILLGGGGPIAKFTELEQDIAYLSNIAQKKALSGYNVHNLRYNRYSFMAMNDGGARIELGYVKAADVNNDGTVTDEELYNWLSRVQFERANTADPNDPWIRNWDLAKKMGGSAWEYYLSSPAGKEAVKKAEEAWGAENCEARTKAEKEWGETIDLQWNAIKGKMIAAGANEDEIHREQQAFLIRKEGEKTTFMAERKQKFINEQTGMDSFINRQTVYYFTLMSRDDMVEAGARATHRSPSLFYTKYYNYVRPEGASMLQTYITSGYLELNIKQYTEINRKMARIRWTDRLEKITPERKTKKIGVVAVAEAEKAPPIVKPVPAPQVPPPQPNGGLFQPY